MRRGPDWLLHAIIDRLVDDTLPLVDDLGDRLDTIEDAMLADNPRQDELRSLHQVRRQLVRLHRITAPERDILRGFARESDLIGEDAYRYFQDVGDHVARVLDAIETYQDVAASVMDVYLSAQNNRMNEIMKQLTVVATIFMPLTLLSGIYGMNVVAGMWPPPLARWSFAFVVGVDARSSPSSWRPTSGRRTGGRRALAGQRRRRKPRRGRITRTTSTPSPTSSPCCG